MSPIVQVALCERTLIKQTGNQFKTTRAKQCQNEHTLESQFDRHLEHMASYQGMQSGLLVGLLVFLVGVFGALEIFKQK